MGSFQRDTLPLDGPIGLKVWMAILETRLGFPYLGVLGKTGAIRKFNLTMRSKIETDGYGVSRKSYERLGSEISRNGISSRRGPMTSHCFSNRRMP